MRLPWIHLSLISLCTTSAFTISVQGSNQQVLAEQSTSTVPQITIRNGTILGASANDVDSFRGIPFAKPPVGTLRLQRPQPLDSSFGTLNATSLPQACSQQLTFNVTQTVPRLQAAIVNNPELQSIFAGLVSGVNEPFAGEDCLTLNVQRNSNTNSSSKLPVLFWIYGGGWELGSTQFYDATQFLRKAASLGHEFVFVAANYRLGAFGFLPGREVQAEGVTNLGIHDQRLAMKWVQENIEAFGGDPEKVTIWGESAGGVSTFIHLLANEGNNERLFRAAIMESGMAYNTLPVDSDPAQQLFDQIVEYCNCTTATDKLVCLRSTPYEILQGANRAQPNIFEYQSLAIRWAPRPDKKDSLFSMSPYESLRRGLFARVPIISGNQEDEGTLWAIARGLDTLSTTDQVISYFTTWWPTAARRTVARFIKTYPSDPAAGSPFGTGQANQLYGAYKRVAAIIGDWVFTLARRISLHYMYRHCTPAIYSYIQTFFHGLPILGTFHVTDVFLEFDIGVDFPDTQAAVWTYYTSFLYYMDPNRLLSQLNETYGRREWPLWTDDTPVLLEFGANSSGLRPDTFRQRSYEVFLESADELQVI